MIHFYRCARVLALGAFCAFAAMADSINLITDPGFENGSTAWTILDPDGDNSTLRYSGNYLGALPNNGNWFIWGGEVNPEAPGEVGTHAGTVAQTIATTPGVTYVLSFWLRNLSYGGPAQNEAEVYWNSFPAGSEVADLVNIPATSNYQFYSYNVVGTGSDTLTFELFNPPTAILLDDVSLTEAPEPALGGLVGGAIAMAFLFVRRRRSA